MEAIGLISEEQFSLILLDINLPDMQGTEVLEKIRIFNPHIPVIAVTAYAMKGDRDTFLSYGFTEYISKPVDLNTLYSLIQTYCYNKKQ